jgi:hypothetical protein
VSKLLLLLDRMDRMAALFLYRDGLLGLGSKVIMGLLYEHTAVQDAVQSVKREAREGRIHGVKRHSQPNPCPAAG